MMNKLLMTSLLQFFSRIMAFRVALVWTGGILMTLLLLRPYIRRGDDQLVLFCENEIYLLVFLIYTSFFTGGEYNRRTDIFLSVLLISMTVIVIILFVLLVFKSFWRVRVFRKRLKNRGHGKRESALNVEVSSVSRMSAHDSTFDDQDVFFPASPSLPAADNARDLRQPTKNSISSRLSSRNTEDELETQDTQDTDTTDTAASRADSILASSLSHLPALSAAGDTPRASVLPSKASKEGSPAMVRFSTLKGGKSLDKLEDIYNKAQAEGTDDQDDDSDYAGSSAASPALLPRRSAVAGGPVGEQIKEEVEESVQMEPGSLEDSAAGLTVA